MCIEKPQERAGMAAELCWDTWGAQLNFRQERVEWGSLDNLPCLWTFMGKEKTTSDPVSGDISLPALLPLSRSWVLGEPHKYSLASLATGKGLDTRQLGQTGLCGHHCLPAGKPCALARLTSQPASDPFPQASSPWNGILFFHISFWKEKHKNETLGFPEMSGESRAFRWREHEKNFKVTQSRPLETKICRIKQL